MDELCLFLSTETADPISAVIRFFTLCSWSHCGWVRLTDGYTYSAMNDRHGVAWRKPNKHVKLLKLRAPYMREAFNYALRFEGCSYDLIDIAGMFMHRNWMKPSSFICDRLVFQSFAAIGRPLVNHQFLPMQHLWPRDILLSNWITER